MNKISDIGLIGLAVMGENLVLNMESKGFYVSVYNRSLEKVDHFLSGRGKNKNIFGAHNIKEFIDSLKHPRKIMLMVKAGQPVDDIIELLIPFLDKGDIIIDGGNSHYPDTIRRTRYIESLGLYYIGTGVSGGEEGALLGPSIMPGGSSKAWPMIKPVFQSIAAKVKDGTPCCDWIGDDGAGHFVKMIHNGIEYGDMQLICEAYQILKDITGMSADEMHEVFTTWNKTDLNSYLIEITGEILAYKDIDGKPLIDKILDTAGQKGTGKWTGIVALDLGVPLTLITEAVFSRCLSSFKDERVKTSVLFNNPSPKLNIDRQKFTNDVKNALFASKLTSYAQGFQLMRAAAKEYNWDLNYGSIALMWRGGCIIRSAFLEKIKDAFDLDPQLTNLIINPYFKEKIKSSEPGWRNVVATAITYGIPVPSMSSALNYFDGYRSALLPANLLQAQRDYFGAHTYERTDKPRGEFFHTNWTGRGGDTSSSTYNV